MTYQEKMDYICQHTYIKGKGVYNADTHTLIATIINFKDVVTKFDEIFKALKNE